MTAHMPNHALPSNLASEINLWNPLNQKHHFLSQFRAEFVYTGQLRSAKRANERTKWMVIRIITKWTLDFLCYPFDSYSQMSNAQSMG